MFYRSLTPGESDHDAVRRTGIVKCSHRVLTVMDNARKITMKHKVLIIMGVLVVAGAGLGLALYSAFPVQMAQLAGMARNYFLTLGAPPGSASTEMNPDYQAPAGVASLSSDEALSNQRSGTGRATTEH